MYNIQIALTELHILTWSKSTNDINPDVRRTYISSPKCTSKNNGNCTFSLTYSKRFLFVPYQKKGHVTCLKCNYRIVHFRRNQHSRVQKTSYYIILKVGMLHRLSNTEAKQNIICNIISLLLTKYYHKIARIWHIHGNKNKNGITLP